MAQNVHGEQATSLLNEPQTFILDVRTPEEFRTGALKRAVLIPIDNLERRLGDLPENKNMNILIYCAHGVRSAFGAHLLERNGYTQVYNLTGGIVAFLHQKP